MPTSPSYYRICPVCGQKLGRGGRGRRGLMARHSGFVDGRRVPCPGENVRWLDGEPATFASFERVTMSNLGAT